MRHRWIEKKDGSKRYQVCSRCGVKRIRESAKLISRIIPVEPYYCYEYESRWAYFVGDRKTTIRPDCPPPAPRRYEVNEVVNVIEECHV